jgi:hypothetical protein
MHVLACSIALLRSTLAYQLNLKAMHGRATLLAACARARVGCCHLSAEAWAGSLRHASICYNHSVVEHASCWQQTIAALRCHITRCYAAYMHMRYVSHSLLHSRLALHWRPWQQQQQQQLRSSFLPRTLHNRCFSTSCQVVCIVTCLPPAQTHVPAAGMACCAINAAGRSTLLT